LAFLRARRLDGTGMALLRDLPTFDVTSFQALEVGVAQVRGVGWRSGRLGARACADGMGYNARL